MGELVTDIVELADALWVNVDPEESQTLEALQNAAEALWALWREAQVENDLAA